MKTVICVVLALGLLVGAGCQTDKGSREFVPGRGWVPTN